MNSESPKEQLNRTVYSFYRKASNAESINGESLSPLRRSMFMNFANAQIAKNKSAVTLFTLISAFPVDCFIVSTDDNELIEGPEYEAASRATEWRAKQDISNSKLIVRDLVTLFPVNDVPEVQEFASNQGSPILSELTARLVVTHEDLKAWLKQLGVPVPENWILNTTLSPDQSTERKESSPAMGLLLAIAIQAYGYDPEAARNKTGDIKKTLENGGVKYNVGTILRWLREAHNGFAPQNQNGKNTINTMLTVLAKESWSHKELGPALYRDMAKDFLNGSIPFDLETITDILEDAKQQLT